MIVNLSLAYFFSGGDSGDAVGLRFDKTLQVFAIVLGPVLIGMLVRARSFAFAERSEWPVKIASVLILLGTIVGALVQERERLSDYVADVGVITLLFSVLSLTVGYGVARLARVSHGQSVASCMEIGIHNTTLAMAIALSPALLDNAEMAIPAAVYSVLMFFTAAAAGFALRRLEPASTREHPKSAV